MGIYTRRDSPFWWMLLEGANIRLSTGVPVGTGPARKENKANAQQIYDAAKGDLARGTFKVPTKKAGITFRAHATWYLENVAVHHRGKRRAVSIIRGLIRYFQDTPLTSIDSAAIEEWKTARAEEIQKQSVNRELDLLKPLLGSAVPKHLEHNPASSVKRFPVPRFVPVMILSEEAEAAILAVATPMERAFVLLGLDALLRLGDVRRFTASQFHGTSITAANSKTLKPFQMPASKRLQDALAVLPTHGPEGYYFAKQRTKKNRPGEWRPLAEDEAFYLFADLCDRANVPRGRKVGGITFHSLRHTGASRASRVVKPTAVMRLGGWSSLKQLARYDHPDDSDLLRAVEAIGGSRDTHADPQTHKNPPKVSGF